MNSLQKIAEMRKRMAGLRPADEEDAQMLQILVGFSPLLLKAMPDEPEQLDHYLATAADGAIACRSDDAELLAIHRWNEEEERWEDYPG